jgi:rubrerythrin
VSDLLEHRWFVCGVDGHDWHQDEGTPTCPICGATPPDAWEVDGLANGEAPA